jgi:hypothetical protein
VLRLPYVGSGRTNELSGKCRGMKEMSSRNRVIGDFTTLGSIESD